MVDETDNHDLNKYTQGEDSWDHSSDMDTIEEKLTVRDTDANKSNYTPHDGALYIATDTGTVYDGNGSSWVKASRGFESVNTDSLSHNTGLRDVPGAVDAAISGGLVCGFVSGTGLVATEDPLDNTTDEVAIQTVVDYIETNHSQGHVYIPTVLADGSVLTVENQVQTGENGIPVSFRFIGATPTSGEAPRSGITNGDAMFLIRGDVSAGNVMEGITFESAGFDLQDNDTGVVEFQYVSDFCCKLGRVENFIGDLITLDSNSFQFSINETQADPKDTQATKTARGIVMQNTLGGSPPSDGFIGPFVVIGGNMDEAIHKADGSVKLSGHYEGARGTALINNQGGDIFITPNTTIRGTSNSAHAILHDGGFGIIQPSMVSGADGDGVRVGGSASQVKISPNIRFNNNITGDAVALDGSFSPVRRSTVPPVETFDQGVSVSYPAAAWPTNLRNTNGWRKYRTGTVTVSSGSLVKAEDFANNVGNDLRWDLAINADPNAEPAVFGGIGYDDTNEKQALFLEERAAPGSSVDVTYTVWSR